MYCLLLKSCFVISSSYTVILLSICMLSMLLPSNKLISIFPIVTVFFLFFTFFWAMSNYEIQDFLDFPESRKVLVWEFIFYISPLSVLQRQWESCLWIPKPLRCFEIASQNYWKLAFNWGFPQYFKSFW